MPLIIKESISSTICIIYCSTFFYCITFCFSFFDLFWLPFCMFIPTIMWRCISMISLYRIIIWWSWTLTITYSIICILVIYCSIPVFLLVFELSWLVLVLLLVVLFVVLLEVLLSVVLFEVFIFNIFVLITATKLIIKIRNTLKII